LGSGKRIGENFVRVARERREKANEKRRGGEKARDGMEKEYEAVMEEPVRLAHGPVIDANPCTKRIKDLQEQIHAGGTVAGGGGGRGTLATETGRVRGRRARGNREVRRASVPDGNSNEDKYL